ncbi:hypothetical protein BDZ45DRAFT_746314 [Acephala macrosclerotiorum]|nr:hypothetical protein BDZ45DRAFT_746314 [Acephala macrosclerotiorum]
MKVEKLAIELDCMSVSDVLSTRRTWGLVGDCKNLKNPRSQLQVLYLVCLSDREVLRVSLDHSGELDSQEWSFRLLDDYDQDKDLFKKELGSAWSGVVWDIRLGKSQGHTLWTVAKEYWRPYLSQWASDKKRICEPIKDTMDEKWWKIWGKNSRESSLPFSLPYLVDRNLVLIASSQRSTFKGADVNVDRRRTDVSRPKESLDLIS